jgi:transposase
VPIGAPKDLIECRRFFLEATHPKQRQYEALRAYFVDGRPSQEAATAFGYSVGSFRVLCHHFRRDAAPAFFVAPRHGPQTQPKKSAARDAIVDLRKQNYSVYEISETLNDRGLALSPTAVREVLKAEGFAALPRRLDEERPDRPRPLTEAVADVRRSRSRRAGSPRAAAASSCSSRISSACTWTRSPAPRVFPGPG